MTNLLVDDITVRYHGELYTQSWNVGMIQFNASSNSAERQIDFETLIAQQLDQ